MAVELAIFDLGILKADADRSGKQFYFMKLDSSADFQFTLCGAGEVPIGILQNKPKAAGIAGQIRRVGISKLELAGTVVRGDLVKSDSAGKGVKADTNNDNYGGQVLESGDSGDTVSVLVEFGET